MNDSRVHQNMKIAHDDSAAKLSLKSLDCALFSYKALRKQLEHSRSGDKHLTMSCVSPYTSFML